MNDKPVKTLQNEFLNELSVSNAPVTVFLINGVKLQGQIAMHDGLTVLLRRDTQKQLVYKHAISTIMPNPQPEQKP